MHSGVQCEVPCDVFQIVVEGVTWACRGLSTFIGFYKTLSLEGMAKYQECDQDSYDLQIFIVMCVATCGNLSKMIKYTPYSIFGITVLVILICINHKWVF